LDSKKNDGYISRMMKGITEGNSLRPAITPESLPSIILPQGGGSSRSNMIDDNFFNNNNINNSDDLKSSLTRISSGQNADFKSKSDNSENNNVLQKKNLTEEKQKEKEVSFRNSDFKDDDLQQTHKEKAKISSSETEIKIRDLDSNTNSNNSIKNKFDGLTGEVRRTSNPNIIPKTDDIKSITNLSNKKNDDFDFKHDILYSNNMVYNKLQKKWHNEKNF